ENLDRLPFLLQALDVLPGQSGDVGVEATAKAALGRHNNEQMGLVATRADEERGKAFAAGNPPVEVGQNAVHALSIGACCGRCILRPAQLSRGDHLHGLGDLTRRLNRRDPISQVLQAGHRAVSSFLVSRLWNSGSKASGNSRPRDLEELCRRRRLTLEPRSLRHFPSLASDLRSILALPGQNDTKAKA